MYKLYYIENKINGEMYIGYTKRKKIEERWYHHCSAYSHCRLMKEAIQKFGKDNFTINVIAIYDNEVIVDQEETYWIEQLNPAYNIKSGGSRGKHSEDTKNKIGSAKVGNKYGFKSGEHSWNKGLSKDQQPNYGNSKFIKEQISEMIQLRDNGLSFNAIGRHFNCCHTTVRRIYLSLKEQHAAS